MGENFLESKEPQISKRQSPAPKEAEGDKVSRARKRPLELKGEKGAGIAAKTSQMLGITCCGLLCSFLSSVLDHLHSQLLVFVFVFFSQRKQVLKFPSDLL